MKPMEIATMEVFIELKKHFAVLGIKSDGKSHFDIRNVIIVFLLTYCLIAMSAFILFEAKSLIDFANSFYEAASMGVGILTSSSNVLKRTRIFGLFTRFEDMIGK